MATNIMN